MSERSADFYLKAARYAKNSHIRRRYMNQYRQQKLRDEIRACTACPLHKTRTQAVPWSGPVQAQVALVGEAPGYNEDRQGVPFVGAAGKLLDESLSQAGLSRGNLVILNTVCCRPPGNRDPEREESEACRPFFERQLAESGAWLVLVAGNAALWSCLREYGISQVRGKPLWRDDRVWLPIKHPAWYLRNRDKVGELIADLTVAARILDGYERIPVGSVKTVKGHDGDIGKALEKQGWVFLYSKVLEDKILVLRDWNVEPPGALADLPTYTVAELLKLRMLGEGSRPDPAVLQAIHTLKVQVGGEVL